MPMNQVRDVFVARIRQLMALYEGSKSIRHAATVGAMREDYLRRFLCEMLPPRFHPVTGFVCDAHGDITPQIDLVFIDRSELPTVSLVSETVIVPYEIVLLLGEVKSTITTTTLDQIAGQRNAIASMRSRFLSGSFGPVQPQSRTRPQTIGTFVLAFHSDVGEEKLRDWIQNEMGEPAGICVLNVNDAVVSLFRPVIDQREAPIVTLRSSHLGDYDPLLAFVGTIYRWLYLLALANSTMSDQERVRYMDAHAMWIWEDYLSDYLYERISKIGE